MVVSTADRLRPVPVALTREADVLAALDRLGPSATGHNPDQVSGLPTSGLLAMSIPASFGGADISNLIVAEAVSRLATWDAEAAGETAPTSCGLGTGPHQRIGRTAQGDLRTRCPGRCLRHEAPLEGVTPPRLVQSGLAFALDRVGSDFEISAADWQIIRASGAGSGPIAAILDSKRLSLHGEDPSSELTVHPDYILSLGENADCLARLMTAFLTAAAARGRVGAKTLTSGADPSAAIELELLDAMIQKAASLIDGIQVDDPQST